MQQHQVLKYADLTDETPGAACEASPPGTSVEDAEAADRIVESHRIVRVDGAQRVGDLPRHPPVRRGASGQANMAADARYVRIERDNQVRRRDIQPQAEVGPGATDHPPKEEVHALAGRAIGG